MYISAIAELQEAKELRLQQIEMIKENRIKHDEQMEMMREFNEALKNKL